MLKVDFEKYFDSVDHSILYDRLRNFGVDEQTIELMKLFVQMPCYRNGDLICFTKGVMQGIPLSVLIGNLYMSHIDDYIGKKVGFYRRVGDDILVFDDDIRKLKEIKEYLEDQCKLSKIKMNREKTVLQQLSEEFTYLGLTFNKGLISIPKDKYKKITKVFKSRFSPQSRNNIKQKINHIENFLNLNKYGESETIKAYATAYNLVTDWNQMQKLSKNIYKILAAYLHGGHCFRNFSRAKKDIKNINYQTLIKSMLKFQK
jgi:hypothetical protein